MIQAQIKVFIADDYFLIREGLKKSLKSFSDIEIVGDTSQLTDFFPQIRELKPDTIILEINLCDRPLKELIDEVKKISPITKLLIISDCKCELPILTSIKAGISGFIRKNVSKDELIKALRTIAGGNEYFTPEITKILLQGYISEQTSAHALFSERELEVLKYICKGRSNEQIADILFISEKTIATHKRNIMKKAGVKKTSDLIIWNMENNIVPKNA